MTETSALIFRKGLDRRREVAAALSDDYDSATVDRLKATDYRHQNGRLTFYLAREFGFCYGVDRAVDYAYQTRQRFPDRAVFLTGEIIHNPHVNQKLRGAGIRFLTDPTETPDRLGPEDVVVIPAFGVPVEDLERFVDRGCTLVDTTCGSVLNVWKNVNRYAAEGYTSIIHGKIAHEETRATASQALKHPDGQYLVVLNLAEAALVCRYIRGDSDADRFFERFARAVSPGFDPDRDLRRVGLANQTTMLMTESLAIGEIFRLAMRDRYGEAALSAHFQAFDTICSATQDRQDAILGLLDGPRLDIMIVVGGYNSSNTRNLARLAAERVPTYHIADASCLVSPTEIRHRPTGAGVPPGVNPTANEVSTRGWLPSGGLAVGLTAGASTPNNIVGQIVERLGRLAAVDASSPASEPEE